MCNSEEQSSALEAGNWLIGQFGNVTLSCGHHCFWLLDWLTRTPRALRRVTMRIANCRTSWCTGEASRHWLLLPGNSHSVATGYHFCIMFAFSLLSQPTTSLAQRGALYLVSYRLIDSRMATGCTGWVLGDWQTRQCQTFTLFGWQMKPFISTEHIYVDEHWFIIIPFTKWRHPWLRMTDTQPVI